MRQRLISPSHLFKSRRQNTRYSVKLSSICISLLLVGHVLCCNYLIPFSIRSIVLIQAFCLPCQINRFKMRWSISRYLYNSSAIYSTLAPSGFYYASKYLQLVVHLFSLIHLLKMRWTISRCLWCSAVVYAAFAFLKL